jgi:hypothetical protein
MPVLRWLRIFVPLLLVAVLVAAVVLVFSSRSDLKDARGRVDSSWVPLRRQLDSRYDVLHTAFADDAIRGVPGPFHAIVQNVAFAYQHWRDLETHNGSTSSEVQAANDLEAAGRRLVYAAHQAPRLKGNKPALDKVDAFRSQTTPSTAKAFELDAAHFERVRSRPVNQLAARVLGYDAIPDYDATTG